MPNKKHIYRRTEAGLKAWQSPHSGLPAPYRRILGLIKAPSQMAELVAALTEYPVKDIHNRLEELETLYFITTDDLSVSSPETPEGMPSTH